MTRPAARLATAAAALALFLVSCAPASPATPSSTGVAAASVPASTPTPSDEPTQLSAMFDVGDGRQLYLLCTGSGSPTILLEAGDESGISDWSPVIPGLRTEARTCAYDRAGLGRSDPASGCRGLDDLLGDLESLLKAAAIDGPFVLVGASGGGFLMAGYAARHPGDVAGLVLVETPKALSADLYPEIVPQIRCDAPANIERRDYLGVEHAAWDNRAQIGNFPMVIISNDWGPNAAGPDEAANVQDQRGWQVLSPNSSQVVVTSGHDVPFNEPDLVIHQILSVLEAARAG